MKKNKILTCISLFIALVVLSGCFPSTPATPSSAEQTQAALFAQATLTKVAIEADIATQQALPTDIPEPTATTPADTPEPTATTSADTPTPTLAPTTAPPTADMPEVRISFEPNTTNAVVMGTVLAYQTQRYVAYAFEGQLLDITLTSGQDAALSIFGRDGTVLLSPMGDQMRFRGYLPATQDYLIDVRAAGTNANFNMYIMIPQRLSFAAGAHSLVINGNVKASGDHNFIAHGLAGQTMKVTVEPGGDLALTIYGIDGTILMGSHNFGNTFEGTLPSSQDYIINVDSGPGTGMRPFTLTLDIQ